MSSSSSATPPPRRRSRRPRPPWVELPAKITAAIIHKLGAIEIIENAQKVCTTWRKICKDPALWRVIDMRNLGDLMDMPYDLEKMCRHAVDRSQGQLVDINLEYFASDDLLAYIAQRSGQLRRLRIACGYGGLSEGLSQAVRMFPLLEELHLYLTYIESEAVTAIGCSCPLLKSFTLNEQGCRYPHFECDEKALAVAASMPKLHHLQLIGNKMTNKGLTAILNGCPQLESLDLRKCFNLYLGGDLGTKCSQLIKDLRPPDDSTEDCEFIYGIPDLGSSDGDYPSRYSDIDLTSEESDSPYDNESSDMEGEYSEYESGTDD